MSPHPLVGDLRRFRRFMGDALADELLADAEQRATCGSCGSEYRHGLPPEQQRQAARDADGMIEGTCPSCRIEWRTA